MDTDRYGRRLMLLVIALAMLCVLGAGGAQALASQSNGDDDESILGGPSFFEPFSMTRVYAPSSNATLMSVAPARTGRPPIRIPFRPSLRSPFRPPV